MAALIGLSGSETTTSLVNRPSGFGDRIIAALGRRPIAAFLAFCALIQVTVIATQCAPRYRRLDFSIYYVSALALRKGIDPYRDNLFALAAPLHLDVGAMVHVGETPSLLALLAPLTYATPQHAHVIWLAFNTLALGCSIWMLLGEFAGLCTATAISIAALMLMYAPISQVFVWSQSQVLVLFLLTAGMRALRREENRIAGLAIAVAGLLRAYPLLMVGYLAMRRRWSALTWTAIFGALGLFATIYVAGPARCSSWLHVILWNSGYWQSGLAFNIGLAPFISRLFWYQFGPSLSAPIELLRHAAVLAGQGAILMLLIRNTPRSDPDSRVYGMWVAAAIVLSPIAWPHYEVLLLIPFAMTLRAAMRGRASIWAIAAMAANYLLVAIWLRFWASFEPHFYAGSSHTSAIVVLIAELGFPILMLGFASAWWSVTEMNHE